jgi:hypothetical protein
VPHLGRVDHLDELLELAGTAGQPVQGVDQHAVSRTGGQVHEHLKIGRAGLAGEGGEGVVHVLLAYLPAQVGGELAAVLQLTLHTQSLPGLIAADAGVDGG